MTAGTSTRWGTRMSTLAQWITLVSSEVRLTMLHFSKSLRHPKTVKLKSGFVTIQTFGQQSFTILEVRTKSSEERWTKNHIVVRLHGGAFCRTLSSIPSFCFPGAQSAFSPPQHLLVSHPFLPPLDGDVLAIKEHLIDELDYILVPTEGWNKLVSWYGLTDSQEPIARKVRLRFWVSDCGRAFLFNETAAVACWWKWFGLFAALVCTVA